MRCFFSKINKKSKSRSMNSQSEIPKEFRYVDGRRFHNVENAAYLLPNDDNEIDMMRYIWQSNFSVPINHILSNPGAKSLDIGYVLFLC
ncbi:hypothetical protein C2G38_443255 [Gigaspora rosea]|uniref:Uncharacterized protein n=1 Tax=Gigaspora rosea TaxID=44941 RepID=A0A397UIX4_9GLOM|nr:hypothetical protein C2G38_443255 [Gigaspora rosea]